MKKIGVGVKFGDMTETSPDLEQFPDEAKIRKGFEFLLEREGLDINEAKHKIERDEKGEYIHSWDVIFPDGEGTKVYSYKRAGEYPGSHSSDATVIDLVFFDNEENPAGGQPLAEYVNGEWEPVSG